MSSFSAFLHNTSCKSHHRKLPSGPPVTDAPEWPCRHEKIDFWDNVYGFDFSAIKRLAMQEPLVDVVDQEQVVTEACKLSTFNISDMTKSDAAFTVRPACHVLLALF